MKWLPAFLIVFFLQPGYASDPPVYKTENGTVKFHSDAQLEIIRASSGKLRGLLNTESRKFAFVVPVSSFEGFNSALQKEHFNENYMESDRIPMASFSGKIIEEVDFLIPGTTTVRAKGIFNLHGIEQERIIRVTMVMKENTIEVSSRFTVLLKDHNIKIPNIVHEKVATEISVELQAELKKQDS